MDPVFVFLLTQYLEKIVKYLNNYCRAFFFQDFEHSVLTLTHNCGVVIDNGEVQIKKSTNKHTMFFSQMFEPFLMGYWVRTFIQF